MTTLDIELLDHYTGEPPNYAHPDDAGFDLRAAIASRFENIYPGRTLMVPTGIRMGIPNGFEVQVRPRSGLAARYGLTVLNAPGTVDSGFRGEVQVILHNCSNLPVRIERGMRIAQAVMAPVVHPKMNMTTVNQDTPRGTKGFGSTGTE